MHENSQAYYVVLQEKGDLHKFLAILYTIHILLWEGHSRGAPLFINKFGCYILNS